jgi:hypothetical protein
MYEWINSSAPVELRIKTSQPPLGSVHMIWWQYRRMLSVNISLKISLDVPLNKHCKITTLPT